MTSLGVSVASTLINGVIGQYVCKMNRCKLCDAPVLESTNRRQLASTTSQRCRAVLMGLAIETTKTKESGESMNQGTCVQGASTGSRSTWHCIREDLKSKISLRLRIKWNRLCIKWNSPILTLMQSRVKRPPRYCQRVCRDNRTRRVAQRSITTFYSPSAS